MQGFRLLGSVVNSDNFNAVAYRLTSQGMIQVEFQLVVVNPYTPAEIGVGPENSRQALHHAQGIKASLLRDDFSVRQIVAVELFGENCMDFFRKMPANRNIRPGRQNKSFSCLSAAGAVSV